METKITRKKSIALGISILILLAAGFISYRYVTSMNVYARAIHEAEAGNLSVARKGFKETVRLNPWHAGAHYELGVLLKKEKKVQEALAFMKRAIELDRDEPDYYIGIGFLYYNDIKDRKQAKVHFKKAYSLDRQNQFASYMLARVSESERNLDQAIYYYRKAIKVNPEMTIAQKQLAMLYGAKGMDVEARSLWGSVLEIDPNDEDAKAYFENSGVSK